MNDNLSTVVTSVLELILEREYQKASEKIANALNKYRAVDFRSRQKAITVLVRRRREIENAKNNILSQINSMPEDSRLHAREALRDTISLMDSKIHEYRFDKKRLSKPR